MRTRLLCLAAAGLAVAAGAAAPATAAAKFAGSYTVTLQPDPLINVLSLAGLKKCQSVRPDAVDLHKLTVPAAGKLKVVLDSPDPTGRGVTDWDLYVLDASDEIIGKGTGATSHEEVTVTFKGKAAITLAVCNLIGSDKGTVTYSLK